MLSATLPLLLLSLSSAAALKCLQCKPGGQDYERCLAGLTPPSECAADEDVCLLNQSQEEGKPPQVLWRRCGRREEVKCSTHKTGNGLGSSDGAWPSRAVRSDNQDPIVKVCQLGCAVDGCNGGWRVALSPTLSLLVALTIAFSLATLSL